MSLQIEVCPICGADSAVRPKLLLIDEAWVPSPEKDERDRYHVDLRADNVESPSLREQPLEQFVDGLYCERCKTGFVPESMLKSGAPIFRCCR